MSKAFLRWLTFWRVYVGLVWFEYGSSKFEPDWAKPNGEFLSAIKAYASGTHGPPHDFVVGFVIPHQQIFAHLIAYGEVLVGTSLILGLLTKVGAVGGMFLSLNYLFATGKYQVRFGVESIELLLFVSCFLLLVLPSGSLFSLDAVVHRTIRRRNPSH